MNRASQPGPSGALAVLAAANPDDLQVKALWNPVFDPIRDDPRFKAVLKKMGLPYTPPDTKTQ